MARRNAENPSDSLHQPNDISRRGLLLATLGAGAGLLVTACGGDTDKESPEPGVVNPNGQVTETEQPEIDMLSRKTFDVRHEPMTEIETSWSVLRSKLDELGSKPQVVPVAYEFTDMLLNSWENNEPIGSEHFTQLSHNFLVATNLILANRNKFNPGSPELAHLVRGSLQDTLAFMSYGDINARDDILESWFMEYMNNDIFPKVSETGVIREFSINRYNANTNDLENGGMFINFVFDNQSGGIETIEQHQLLSIYPMSDLAPTDAFGAGIIYNDATDYDKPVELGIYL